MDAIHRRSTEAIANERGLIVNWLVKLVLGFVIVAVVIYDGGSILINFFTLDSKADEMAVALMTGVTPGSLSETQLETEAHALAKAAGVRLIDLRVEGNVVFVTLRRRADTLVVKHIGPIADWARATAEGQAGT